jgi:hypothetical protein
MSQRHSPRAKVFQVPLGASSLAFAVAIVPVQGNRDHDGRCLGAEFPRDTVFVTSPELSPVTTRSSSAPTNRPRLFVSASAPTTAWTGGGTALRSGVGGTRWTINGRCWTAPTHFVTSGPSEPHKQQRRSVLGFCQHPGNIQGDRHRKCAQFSGLRRPASSCFTTSKVQIFKIVDHASDEAVA